MKQVCATADGLDTLIKVYGNRWGNVISDTTRAHERQVMKEWTWPALPAHLHTLPDARAMVRHWVRTDYHWKP